MAEKLLEVKNLKKYFPTPDGLLHAVDNVNFHINRGETLGLVGESGCGKSTTGRVILRLLDLTDGEVMFEGDNVSDFNKSQLREYRMNAQMVFQDPFASLNPRMSLANIIGEPFEIHKVYDSKNERMKQVRELFEIVGLSERLLNSYPHELDGGRRQRVGIARALALRPKFIVLDEPVSALDVSIQAQILNLLDELQEEFGLTYLFIAHDLSVVKHVSDRICVMYLGEVVEMSDYRSLFKDPLHPYSQALISAIPTTSLEKKERIILKGDIPSPINPGQGCRFYQRCFRAQDICKEKNPELIEHKPGRHAACHFAGQD